MPPTRGRSRSVSLAALARRASEERGTMLIDLDDSPPTSGCMTPHNDPRLSLSDQVHVAYALDDIHLAKILLLKLKGIEVTSDSDPRIAAVQPEDFDECFLPNGPFMSEEDEEAIKEMQRAERERLRVEHEKQLLRLKEAEEERKRREWEVQCERIWEREKKRIREEKEFVERKREEERKRWEENEKRRLAKEAEVKQRRAQLAAAKAARAAFASPKISYAQLGHHQQSLPDDDLLYNVITPNIRAKRPASSASSSSSSSSHCFPSYSTFKSSPPDHFPGTSISFQDVLASMRGSLFPLECQPERRRSRDSSHSHGNSHDHSHSHSVSVRRKRRDDELLSALLVDVKWEDDEWIRRSKNGAGSGSGKGKEKEKEKEKQSDAGNGKGVTMLGPRPFQPSRQNSTTSVASSNSNSDGCPACSSSPSPISASTSPSTSSSSSTSRSWFSFGSSSSSLSSVSSTSTNITTPSTSPPVKSTTSGPTTASGLRNWLRVRAVTNASISSLHAATPVCTCSTLPSFKPSHLTPIPVSVEDSPLWFPPSSSSRTLPDDASDSVSGGVGAHVPARTRRKSTSRESIISLNSILSITTVDPNNAANTVNTVVSSLNRFVELAKGFQSAYLQATVFAQVNGYDVGDRHRFGSESGEGESDDGEKLEERERERMWREEARRYREFKDGKQMKRLENEVVMSKTKKRKLRPVGYRATKEDVGRMFILNVGGGSSGTNASSVNDSVKVGAGVDPDLVCPRCSKLPASSATDTTSSAKGDSERIHSKSSKSTGDDQDQDNYQWIPLHTLSSPIRPTLNPNRPRTKLPNPLPFPIVFKPETPLTTSPLRRMRMMQQAKEREAERDIREMSLSMYGHSEHGMGGSQGRFARRSSSSPPREYEYTSGSGSGSGSRSRSSSPSSYFLSCSSSSARSRTRNPIPRPRYIANPVYLRVRALNNRISSIEAQRMGLTGGNGSTSGKLREKVVGVGFEEVGRSLLGIGLYGSNVDALVGGVEDGDTDCGVWGEDPDAEVQVEVQFQVPVRVPQIPVQRGRPAVAAGSAGYVRRGRCVVRG
ncbi:hypothetical protein D9758_009653 [Tetrapyrgos nigripes]|uniref:Uncharacterized protein n=1 Tax=Tetrapyrgos nigripes TaxID=182062 RepID=A0A8H5FQA8_9AGAR|nr:hypothetical protein D9758_009653 [Tetrapyrgos nigripes]